MIKIKKLPLVTLIITIFYTFFSGCSSVNKNQVINTKRLATQYYQQDTQWYLDNIPFFECSDKQIQEVYYYRWKLYKAHIRDVGENQYVITEFIDDVDWDREPYSSINCASVFHIYEGRWLKNNNYMDGYIDYLYSGGGNNRSYSENIADATFARFLVNADSAFIFKQFGIIQQIFEKWYDHFDPGKKLYYITPDRDAMEYSLASLDASGGKDGWGGEAFRPTINSYMYANAMAISRMAAIKKDTSLRNEYFKKATDLKSNLISSLWNGSLAHFTDRYHVTTGFVHYWDFIRGRELAGYVPWCYNLPDNTPEYNAAWNHLMDTAKFRGGYGLRTAEPSYEYYMKQYRYDADNNFECQWNGPSWPYLTTQVLLGMANLRNNYTQDFITPSDYLEILKLYTQQHYLPNGRLNLQENYNPDTGNPMVGLYRSSHYNHSGYIDLIITGLCGLRPSGGNMLEINPIVDNSIQYFCLSDVLYHGHKLSVVYDADGRKYQLGKGLSVFVDGKKVSLKENKGKYEVEIGAPIVIKNTAPPIDFALNIRKKGFPIPSASINSVPDSLFPAIDGRIWYFSEVKNRWSTFGSTSTTDWYALDFGENRDISSVKLHFFADSKTYDLPGDIAIEYKNGEIWLPLKIKEKIPANLTGNTENMIRFDKTTINQIRINLKQGVQQLPMALVELECY